MIFSILGNVKYKGEALLQQNYTADFITKTVKKNIGELNQYYITAGHEAIIDRQLFDYVQEELKRRAEKQRRADALTFIFIRKRLSAVPAARPTGRGCGTQIRRTIPYGPVRTGM